MVQENVLHVLRFFIGHGGILYVFVAPVDAGAMVAQCCGMTAENRHA
jgi:hypothetical protein